MFDQTVHIWRLKNLSIFHFVYNGLSRNGLPNMDYGYELRPFSDQTLNTYFVVENFPKWLQQLDYGCKLKSLLVNVWTHTLCSKKSCFQSRCLCSHLDWPEIIFPKYIRLLSYIDSGSECERVRMLWLADLPCQRHVCVHRRIAVDT